MTLVLAGATAIAFAQDDAPFNGLYLDLGNLPRLSHAKTRSISPENFTGEKGKGGMATEGTGAHAARDLGQGWKISPSVQIEAQKTFTLAEIEGPGAIQQIWMTPTGNWRYSILRFYWDGETEPSVEVPVGRLLRQRMGPVRAGQLDSGHGQPGQRVQLLLGDAVPQVGEDHAREHRGLRSRQLRPRAA